MTRNNWLSLQKKLPHRKDLVKLFLVCIFPIQTWLYFVFFQSVPGYLYRLELSDIIGILAYGQVHALLETTFLVGILTIFSMALPEKWYANYFFSQSSILVLSSAIWFVPIHFVLWRLKLAALSLRLYLVVTLICLALYFITLVTLSIGLRLTNRLDTIVRSFANSLTILATIYIALDFVSIFIILLRNST